MILQTKQASNLATFPKQYRIEKNPTDSLTIPNQAFDLAYAMKQYKAGTLVERAKGYYEQKGLETPDFDRMSKVEQLTELAKYRKLVKTLPDQINSEVTKAQQKVHEKLVEKQQKEGNADKANSARPNTSGKDGNNRPSE